MHSTLNSAKDQPAKNKCTTTRLEKLRTYCPNVYTVPCIPTRFACAKPNNSFTIETQKFTWTFEIV